jgi:metallo-beta-lactamase family protein
VPAQLTFAGAVGGVTGSCYHLALDGASLVIDCGTFQGGRIADELNHKPWKFDPSTVDALVLTHGHLDHCGRVPLLSDQGFSGPIWGHAATLDIAMLIMEDTAKIAAHSDGPPMYDRDSVERVRARLKRHPGYGKRQSIGPFTVELFDAGHILGSSHVRVSWQEQGSERAILFSGDIGVVGSPIIRDPNNEWPEETAVDWVVTESTYGNRNHPDRAAAREQFRDVIQHALLDGGKVLIPAFAIGRTQEILFELDQMITSGEVGRIPVVVDGPLGLSATQLYRRHKGCYDEAALEQLERGDHPLDMDSFIGARDGRDSSKAAALRGAAIIIAGSGMCNGGRIRRHLAENLHDPKTDVVLVGYQGARTLGRSLQDGAREVRIDNREIQVNARITRISGFSAHADQDGLASWYGALRRKSSGTTFVTHGDDEARDTYSQLLRDRFGARTAIPGLDDTVTLA